MESLIGIIVMAFVMLGFVLVAAIIADKDINKDQRK